MNNIKQFIEQFVKAEAVTTFETGLTQLHYERKK